MSHAFKRGGWSVRVRDSSRRMHCDDQTFAERLKRGGNMVDMRADAP